VTDLYEAGDINQTNGGGASADDDIDEFDDELDDDVEDELNDEIDGNADDDGDNADDAHDAHDAHDADANLGNEVTAAGSGTSHAVLHYLARSLANEPDSVVIETEERRGGVRLNLHVAPEDMGRVIGRRGRTAQAIRTVVNVAGAKDGVQASVDIVDD
jgi:uncharacterized protein